MASRTSNGNQSQGDAACGGVQVSAAVITVLQNLVSAINGLTQILTPKIGG